MTPKQILTIQDTWQQITASFDAQQVATIFYDKLFSIEPELAELFTSDVEEHGQKLVSMFDFAVKSIDQPDTLIPALQKLGQRHRNYGVEESHYELVGEALIYTLEQALADDFDLATKRAWLAVYRLISKTMIEASQDMQDNPNTSEIDNVDVVASTEDYKEETVMEQSNTSVDIGDFILGALEQSGTAFMMIDRDFVITYVNQSTMDLLEKHESTFQKKWPSFSAQKDKIIGACIDGFHVKPEHRRKLLSDPNNLPWGTDIQIEDVIIELNVTAIFDKSGEYVGNSLEWQDVTQARNNTIEVGRLTSAVEGMTTNLMMADPDGNIVYANPAVLEMLQSREEVLQSVLPSFRANSIVGTNFDSFHANPHHQRNLLGNPENLPYRTEIKVSNLVFELIAIALLDENGKHQGTAIQWLDMTAQRDAQDQVDKLITAAIDGRLDQRIDTQSYQGFMKELGNNINALMDSVIEPINDAIDTAKSLERGELDNLMNDQYKGEFNSLATAMNASISNLTDMVGEIRSVSKNVFEAAKEIAAGNSELSHRTESQASSLEETASAMEEITSTVVQNAESAAEASKLSSDVMTKASNGGDVVKNAISAMSEINKSSKKIADIISVIDEIAFQTNLLALNAAVEAARAGEQGRGFAVVAAEVRNLAQRSAGAAKEIKGLINDSVDAVSQGTKLVDETGQTFEVLVSSIEEVSQMLCNIDTASREQSTGVGEISASISQMDEMTQQNAALVEEVSSSSKAMEEQSQRLLKQVAVFKSSQHESVAIEQNPNNIIEEKRAPDSPMRQGVAKKVANLDHEWEEF